MLYIICNNKHDIDKINSLSTSMKLKINVILTSYVKNKKGTPNADLYNYASETLSTPFFVLLHDRHGHRYCWRRFFLLFRSLNRYMYINDKSKNKNCKGFATGFLNLRKSVDTMKTKIMNKLLQKKGYLSISNNINIGSKNIVRDASFLKMIKTDFLIFPLNNFEENIENNKIFTEVQKIWNNCLIVDEPTNKEQCVFLREHKIHLYLVEKMIRKNNMITGEIEIKKMQTYLNLDGN